MCSATTALRRRTRSDSDDVMAAPPGTGRRPPRSLSGPGAQALLLLAQLRAERLAEVFGLEHLPDLDLSPGARHRVRAALGPVDRFLLRADLPEPEARDQVLRLRERPLDDGPPVARDAHARALARRLQPLAREENAGLRQLVVVFAHR